MDKTKILFVNYSLHSGGVEKSLVTILSVIDYDKYDVDLQLFVKEGLFLNNVPSNVNVLPPMLPKEYKLNIRQAFLALLKMGKLKTAFCRLLVTLTSRTGSLGERFKRVYNIEKKLLKSNPKEYDTVIAFMEGQPLYYAVEFTKAKRKIGFIHGDYKAMGLSKNFDIPYFDKLNALCTVSEGCKNSLDEVFPDMKNRHHLIYNIISSQMLNKMADSGKGFTDDYNGKRVLTIARLSYQKGLDIGIETISRLADYDFKWYIIGIGPLEYQLKEQAKALGVDNKIVFLGETDNPYQYIKNCDLYFQPSRFEGKAIAVDEACVFNKPILLGEYSTAHDQIENGVEGVICPLNADMLADELKSLLEDNSRAQAFSSALKNKRVTNEEEINKLYALF